jgi:hypothetical protein
MFRKLAATDAMAVSLNFPKRKIPAGYGTRRNNMTTRKSAVLIAALLCSVALAPGAVAEDSLGEPGREVGKPNPLKNVYFGEQHMHTRNSFDAFTIGVGQTWDQAYRFAKGEKVKLSTTGDEMQRRTPYDFVAITDHSEYYGVLKDFKDPKSPLSKSDFAKSVVAGIEDPSKAGPAVQKLIQTLVKSEPLPEYVTPELRMSNWQKFLKAADEHYDPGKFTTLYAYEWTSIPDGANMHRNVFFKDKAAAVPFSSFDSILPEDLWTYLEIQRNQGIDVFAIPHNGNVSDGWMFSPNKFLGGPMDARYARRQMENEPLFEMHQTKGNSEAHPWLSPNDEFANFEPFPSLISLGTPSAIKNGFYRQGLVMGMKLEKELGFNPYKMGAVGGADVHSGYSGNEEWDWNGAHGTLDDTPKKRLNPVPNATGETGYGVSSAGTTAVWTTENTREGIWNGMLSRETYGTTGTLIRLRFFGSWDLPAGLVEDKDFVKKAYATGVPMGQDLPAHPLKDLAKSPSFAVWALKDPESGNLDRIQIIKVWTNQRTGFPAEKIYDVAWSDMKNRQPDPTSGKLPPVGNTVDIKKATFTNDIGDSQLSAVWTDPDFDPTIRAAYYVRVLEIPTPRWSTYDAKKLGVDPPKGVPATIQERAYSSPIWYTPSPEIMAKVKEKG